MNKTVLIFSIFLASFPPVNAMNNSDESKIKTAMAVLFDTTARQDFVFRLISPEKIAFRKREYDRFDMHNYQLVTHDDTNFTFKQNDGGRIRLVITHKNGLKRTAIGGCSSLPSKTNQIDEIISALNNPHSAINPLLKAIEKRSSKPPLTRDQQAEFYDFYENTQALINRHFQ